MGQIERLYRLRQILEAGGCVQPAMGQRELEVSRATLTRDIQHLRDRMRWPVVWCRDRGGWRLDRGQPVVGVQYELPGFYLSAEEIHALLTMQHLLADLDASGLLAGQIDALRRKLAQLLDGGLPAKAEAARRIRVLTVGARKLRLAQFQVLGSALLRRRRVVVNHHSRSSNTVTTGRELSPQRLVHYRDNWYLDAWCHMREALRSFSVDTIEAAQTVDRAAIDVADAELDAVLGSGYGIFAGRQVRHAQLRFTPERARWVAAERWHPDQHGRWDASGHWLLTLPYADPRELVMDILRHMPDVDVLAPDELRDEVLRRLHAGIARMTG